MENSGILDRRKLGIQGYWEGIKWESRDPGKGKFGDPGQSRDAGKGESGLPSPEVELGSMGAFPEGFNPSWDQNSTGI